MMAGLCLGKTNLRLQIKVIETRYNDKMDKCWGVGMNSTVKEE